MDKDSESRDRIARAMTAAWSRVKKLRARLWGDWMTIGEGLLEGRRWAMQMAGTNRPEGKGYVTAYAEWLKRYKVDDMDKSDRAKLLQLMEERPAVEEWRAALPNHERLSLNNPVIAWRKWTAATRVKKPKPHAAGVSANEHGRAADMIAQQQARIAELEEELTGVRERPDGVAAKPEQALATLEQILTALVALWQDKPPATVVTESRRLTQQLNERLMAIWSQRGESPPVTKRKGKKAGVSASARDAALRDLGADLTRMFRK